MLKAEMKMAVLNYYPDAHYLQGDMKFATQISPLLNLITFLELKFVYGC